MDIYGDRDSTHTFRARPVVDTSKQAGTYARKDKHEDG